MQGYFITLHPFYQFYLVVPNDSASVFTACAGSLRMRWGENCLCYRNSPNSSNLKRYLHGRLYWLLETTVI